MHKLQNKSNPCTSGNYAETPATPVHNTDNLKTGVDFYCQISETKTKGLSIVGKNSIYT